MGRNDVAYIIGKVAWDIEHWEIYGALKAICGHF